ncbi:hypothetical protein HK102_008516 [Quaeritorhiza haematococci]|nr:hypothetical protein HK102_008516 [Quaeritorhiza haematococci]
MDLTAIPTETNFEIKARVEFRTDSSSASPLFSVPTTIEPMTMVSSFRRYVLDLIPNTGSELVRGSAKVKLSHKGVIMDDCEHLFHYHVVDGSVIKVTISQDTSN